MGFLGFGFGLVFFFTNSVLSGAQATCLEMSCLRKGMVRLGLVRGRVYTPSVTHCGSRIWNGHWTLLSLSLPPSLSLSPSLTHTQTLVLKTYKN